ncbi:AMP-dependent synthetase/ligase [Granulosicoccus antarcticus]|uniref:Long-chain-fatty-acid--CoA ligase FadD15 n=1 Tax=Granulosicoccus antarcticus IMCC3135 TaxID=1192854 RepID=A0A2Z2P183_9GAMM|nr:AMP-binding protein [Granulosicoccus antarcticus]ASJ74960.1 Long-chain-fatty-acid--CoA ligase FadD15 [Granulosicoccus antarcticus IMCC3135]
MHALPSLPHYLLRNAEHYANRVAMRHKDLGIWREWTWADVCTEVQIYALGLRDLDLQPGDKVAIIGANRPRLYWSFAAIQSIGAIPVPMYADAVAEEMVFVLEHAGVRFAVCQDQEQVDKVLSVQDQLPLLEQIFYDEPRGMRDYDAQQVLSIDAVQKRGKQTLERDRHQAVEWRSGIDKLVSDELCVMLYTSGTTGRPKGVMLSHRNLIVTSINANTFDKLDVNEETIAYLPLAWVGDHVFSYGQSLTAGYCVCCPESLDTITADRREIAPTYFFAPPRVFESLLTTIMVAMEDASRPKRVMFDHFIKVAKRHGENVLNGVGLPLLSRLHYALGDLMVYAPLKNRLGMSKVRVAYTAGEAIGPDIFRFYRSLGINLKQLYGQTEASVYITAQPDGQIDADTVGTPAIDVEIRIADNGEVLYRSPGVFMGYYQNEQATAETKTADGWVYTGDAGFMDDKGHLRIIDRAKDVGKLNDGSLFPPKYIENKLKFFSTIKEVVAFGDQRDYVSAFVNIDLTAVSSWAERNNIVYASYQELAGHPLVYEMIESHIQDVNRDLAAEPRVEGACIKRFLILHKELDADDGELTRTQKVRRKFISERYEPLIEALYSDKESQFVSTAVVYEDGRKGTIEADVRIRAVAGTEPTLQKVS